MLNGQENALRERIGKMLADGLKTKTEPPFHFCLFLCLF